MPSNSVLDAGATVSDVERKAFRRFRVTVAIPGVYDYEIDGQIYRVAKLPEELFSPGTIASLEGAPLTLLHPEVSPLETRPGNGSGLVDFSNYGVLAKGATSSPDVQANQLVATVSIWDYDLTGSVEIGDLQEVSGGQTCSWDYTPGVFNGQPYDIVQRNIRFNHVAVVPRGNVGPAARIHLDSKENQPMPGTNENPTQRRLFWRLEHAVAHDGNSNIEVPETVFEELNKIKQAKKAAEERATALDSDLQAAMEQLKGQNATQPDPEGEAEKEALMAKMKELEAMNQELASQVKAWQEKFANAEKELPEKAEQMAEEKTEVMQEAEQIIGDSASLRGMKIRDIKLQVIAKELPFEEGVALDSVSDERINERYSGIVAYKRKAAVAQDARKPAPDTASDPYRNAHAKSFERGMNK
ncbi:MAG: hypothetical protein CMF59_16640 [Leptospiraceae bacterium]|nr:hypothetical protein [Leptospiraceae bacterium]